MSVTSLIAFLIWELTDEHPVVDLRVFRLRTYAVGVFLITMVGFVLFGSLVLLPIFLQTLLGYPSLTLLLLSFHSTLSGRRGLAAVLAFLILFSYETPFLLFLAAPLLTALKWVHGFVGNWGWSIVALTVLINLAMFPLRHKSVVSMRRMQAVGPEVKAIHAGLECGIIGEKYPGMDMISFGPTMEGVHSPDERLHIDTVEKFYAYLLRMLKKAS